MDVEENKIFDGTVINRIVKLLRHFFSTRYLGFNIADNH